jgi:hypothetical protein
MSRRITNKAILNNRRGQGKVWNLVSDNQSLMSEVFNQCKLNNLSGSRLSHAVSFFNKAFSNDRKDFESNLEWFKALMGIKN